jgi:alkylated DNA repair dioxygenase AlkB
MATVPPFSTRSAVNPAEAGDLPPNRAARDGAVHLFPDFLSSADAGALFQTLRAELDWQQETIVIAGRPVLVPRLVCWYGDHGADYRYSGVQHHTSPWTPALQALREKVERRTGGRYNSVLGNYYRSGNDSMGWHADKEKELGTHPIIASLSLGASRRFLLRHNKTREQLELLLTDGSLLLMGGSLQHHWRHCVPKAPSAAGTRINLTFRLILNC